MLAEGDLKPLQLLQLLLVGGFHEAGEHGPLCLGLAVVPCVLQGCHPLRPLTGNAVPGLGVQEDE